ncbi:hypothetical protein PGT21_011705 [Puccinia graminis f. sp. tritici]|uniref:Uncharacterized protein n=1 Tax=Puccinia graminis f. sp. tritici TaxID=56615 RepID=A0A5B0NIW9_PUCGR|nr:hypothetical protein PGT21_011705 [Puccinia graminis f. sp. tritici]
MKLPKVVLALSLVLIPIMGGVLGTASTCTKEGCNGRLVTQFEDSSKSCSNCGRTHQARFLACETWTFNNPTLSLLRH